MQLSTSQIVLNAILSKFGSQKAAADALGISESTFSRNLEKLSGKFLTRLESIGVDLSQYINIYDEKAQKVSLRLQEIGNKLGGFNVLSDMLKIDPKILRLFWEGKFIPANDILEKLKNLGLDVEYIISGNKTFEESNAFPVRGHFYKVIRTINAGDPAYIFSEVNYTGEDMFFPYEKSDRCFSLVVSGDSMTGNNGKSILDGDYVLVDMDAEILNGDIVVVSLVNGRDLIKQYTSGPGEEKVTFKSFNPRNPDIIVNVSDIQVMYRVCMHQPKPRKL